MPLLLDSAFFKNQNPKLARPQAIAESSVWEFITKHMCQNISSPVRTHPIFGWFRQRRFIENVQVYPSVIRVS